jgi:hypothetical protein
VDQVAMVLPLEPTGSSSKSFRFFYVNLINLPKLVRTGKLISSCCNR